MTASSILFLLLEGLLVFSFTLVLFFFWDYFSLLHFLDKLNQVECAGWMGRDHLSHGKHWSTFRSMERLSEATGFICQASSEQWAWTGTPQTFCENQGTADREQTSETANSKVPGGTLKDCCHSGSHWPDRSLLRSFGSVFKDTVLTVFI